MRLHPDNPAVLFHAASPQPGIRCPVIATGFGKIIMGFCFSNNRFFGFKIMGFLLEYNQFLFSKQWGKTVFVLSKNRPFILQTIIFVSMRPQHHTAAAAIKIVTHSDFTITVSSLFFFTDVQQVYICDSIASSYISTVNAYHGQFFLVTPNEPPIHV